MNKKCNHCGVIILDETEKCPLCDGVVEGDDTGLNSYPNIVDKIKKTSILMRILFTVWVLTFGALGIASYYVHGFILSVVVVAASTYYGLFMLWLMTKPQYGYMKRIFLAIIVGVIFIVIIDYVTGFHYWSLNYVLPSGIIFLNFALLLLRFINRRNWRSYIVQQLFVIFLGIVPVIFILNGQISHPILSVIAIAISIMMFVGTLVIGGREGLMELKRRFHI